MTETPANIPQPLRPGAGQKYDLLREAAAVAACQSIAAAVAAPTNRKEIFTMNITATSEKGVPMNNEQKFLIDLIFKPNESGLRLLPQQSQLLLAYFGEILRELEDEINNPKNEDTL
jgi:hypothetical protein